MKFSAKAISVYSTLIAALSLSPFLHAEATVVSTQVVPNSTEPGFINYASNAGRYVCGGYQNQVWAGAESINGVVQYIVTCNVPGEDYYDVYQYVWQPYSAPPVLVPKCAVDDIHCI